MVKLIDVYPDEVADQPGMGGYQLMVAADIFRGRYRESLEFAKAIEPDKALPYRFALPNAVDDQREASGRPDVATFVSGPLDAPLQIAGEPMVNLVASTTGTDADWVVKLIDVYPDEVADQAGMGAIN